MNHFIMMDRDRCEEGGGPKIKGASPLHPSGKKGSRWLSWKYALAQWKKEKKKEITS
jgi:hypothetical protein